VLVWAVAFRFARRYAVLLAVAVAVVTIAAATSLPPGALSEAWPNPGWVLPSFSLNAAIGIGVPLFLVTMASQNPPGFPVLYGNNYRPGVGPVLVTTGLLSVPTAFFGGHSLNLAAITAALCAGPEADPDPGRRWIASVACGVTYMLLGLIAGLAGAFF